MVLYDWEPRHAVNSVRAGPQGIIPSAAERFFASVPTDEFEKVAGDGKDKCGRAVKELWEKTVQSSPREKKPDTPANVSKIIGALHRKLGLSLRARNTESILQQVASEFDELHPKVSAYSRTDMERLRLAPEEEVFFRTKFATDVARQKGALSMVKQRKRGYEEGNTEGLSGRNYISRMHGLESKSADVAAQAEALSAGAVLLLEAANVKSDAQLMLRMESVRKLITTQEVQTDFSLISMIIFFSQATLLAPRAVAELVQRGAGDNLPNWTRGDKGLSVLFPVNVEQQGKNLFYFFLLGCRRSAPKDPLTRIMGSAMRGCAPVISALTSRAVVETPRSLPPVSIPTAPVSVSAHSFLNKHGDVQRCVQKFGAGETIAAAMKLYE